MNKLSDILEAFHFVSGAPPGMLTAILCKDTGQIRYRSVEADLNEIDEEGIDWDAWIEIPHRNDLDLGQELVFEFVESVLPSDYERVQRMSAEFLPDWRTCGISMSSKAASCMAALNSL